ncbi:GAF domain-containing protein [Leptospira ognonensis]|uniref:histidine kinase n=1 Tax=Leptospira ognonensis TaxID=2484945 RepID=A0A4R9K6M9_9LEPT|nr:ATP-binding protein [Leptospira ognonensis]TGL61216.1 GAF domain-containing protein [Leptospira ognonensis]
MLDEKSRICDSEPIHLINELQDFGLLIILSPQTKTIIAVGENVKDYLNRPPDDVLNHSIDHFLPELNDHLIELDEKLAQVKNNVLSLVFTKGKTIYFVNVRKIDAFILLEVEAEEERPAVNAAQDFNSYMASILSSKDLSQVYDFSVKTIQKLAHFDRVVLYKFKEDFSGEVIAESKKENIDSLLGFHFPASDIPLPARKMFENNPIRVVKRKADRILKIIRNREYSEFSFNLGGAGLRAPHPQHMEYLSNMGIDTSVSLSLVCEGRLWGLIICHNLKTSVPRPSVKNYLSIFANLVSVQIDLMLRNEISVSSLEIEKHLLQLIGKINQSPIEEITTIFEKEAPFLSKVMKADGFVFQWKGKVQTFGETPSVSVLNEILDFLDKNHNQKMFYTDQLGFLPNFEREEFHFFPGVLALPISFLLGCRLIWLKKELPRTILWGGNPDHNISISTEGVSPRKSFEKFIQTVKGKSEPWSKTKLSAIEGFLDVRDIIERKLLKEDLEQSLVRIKNSEEELRNLNQTKDRFFSIISHNLRSPFSGLIGMSELLLDALGDKENLDILEVEDYARNISNSADQAFKLINNLFEWGKLQTGKFKINRSNFELFSFVDELKFTFIPKFNEKKVVLKIISEENLSVHSDDRVIFSILTHVLSNAKKYSNRFDEVVCKLSQQDSMLKIDIIDGGVGMSQQDLEKLFKIESKFLNPGTEGENGTGLGLIIAREYLKLLEGEIRVTSEIGKGTHVNIQVPKN